MEDNGAGKGERRKEFKSIYILIHRNKTRLYESLSYLDFLKYVKSSSLPFPALLLRSLLLGTNLFQDLAGMRPKPRTVCHQD